MNGRPEDEISTYECRALRELYRGDYTFSELAFMFECTEETVGRHVNRECHHNTLQQEGTLEPGQKYSNSELLIAFRIVYDKQPYDRMTVATYDKHKPNKFPAARTIHRRFGSWPKVRELAHGE